MSESACLSRVAADTDAAVAQARAQLVRAVRAASANGLTQAEIALAIGRSQPEVSRLLRFHGTTPLARKLRAVRSEVIDAIEKVGGSRVRVFGSVATGTDDNNSDVDLLFAMGRPLSLMELEQLGDELKALVGVSVDVVPDDTLRLSVRDRILAEAVAL